MTHTREAQRPSGRDDTPLLAIETVDAPHWWAVLVIRRHRGNEPDIKCIGFKEREARDRWLEWFAVSVDALAGALPTRI